jgi:hypothetical protein
MFIVKAKDFAAADRPATMVILYAGSGSAISRAVTIATWYNIRSGNLQYPAINIRAPGLTC